MSIPFAIYRISDGVIRVGNDPHPELQVRSGEALLPDPSLVTDPRWQRVIDGEVVSIAQPAAEVAPTLADLKAIKWAVIKAQRDAAISAPKPTSYGLFDAKPADQDNLNKVIALTALAIAHGQPDEARYTLATNERVTLTLAQLQLAALEIGAQTQAVYETASTIRAQIESAESAEALEGIAWPTS